MENLIDTIMSYEVGFYVLVVLDLVYLLLKGGRVLFTSLASKTKTTKDDEIVAKGIGSTYDSIIKECKERWGELNNAQGEECEVYDLNYYAELVFNEADWAYISTTIDLLTN